MNNMDNLPPPKPELFIVEPWGKKEEICKMPNCVMRVWLCFDGHNETRSSLPSGVYGPIVFSNFSTPGVSR